MKYILIALAALALVGCASTRPPHPMDNAEYAAFREGVRDADENTMAVGRGIISFLIPGVGLALVGVAPPSDPPIGRKYDGPMLPYDMGYRAKSKRKKQEAAWIGSLVGAVVYSALIWRYN